MTLKSGLTETERLTLIGEAIQYCQRVRDMGMPTAAWTKALREPVFFLWEVRNGNKASAAKYRSVGARELKWGKREIVYDHAVPFVLVQEALMALEDPKPDAVRAVLDRMAVACIITHHDERKLAARGLSKCMPAGWDGVDPLARYRDAEIAVEPNDRYVSAKLA